MSSPRCGVPATATELVIDASVAVAACYAPDGFTEFGGATLLAPSLMWSEARSVLRELVWRGQMSPEDGDAARARLESCPVGRSHPPSLGDRAWRVADRLGWAKTYDAEYVALAELLSCQLVTLDARLRRATARLGFVVGPGEL